MRLSALVQVYNEELCIGPCLAGLLPVVDECVVVHGGPDGVSTDGTHGIINDFQSRYPDKIIYLEGVFRQDDNQWDHTGQNNLGLSHVTGDFVIRTHADLIYDIDDIAKARKAIDKFPEKKYFYAPMLDFYCDTDHIMLPVYVEPGKLMGRPQFGDPVAISMAARPKYANFTYGDSDQWTKSGMQISLDWQKDIIYLPQVNRYHFAQVKPFKYQVSKMMRNLMRGHYETLGEDLKTKSEPDIYRWIFGQILAFNDHPSRQPYAGDYPSVAESIRHITYLDGYEEFMESFQEK